MKIYNDIDCFKAVNPVITIGTFDGVHRGHLKVIEQLNYIAANVGGESVVFTFYPHPRLVVSANESNLRLLTTFNEKAHQLEIAGVDNLVVYPFSIDFAELNYDKFIVEILIKKLHLHTLVLGHDHRLGKNREGTFRNINSLAKSLSFKVEKIDTFVIDNVEISSSKIRLALQKGEIEKANQLLGYPYSLQGVVVEGNRVGRDIGFPTANIQTSDHYKLIPAEGVYAVTVLCEGEKLKGMLNIGFRPTLEMNADHRTIEIHIFDFDRNIYKKEVTIYFHQRVRDEHKFDNIDSLREQLVTDRVNIERLLSM